MILHCCTGLNPRLNLAINGFLTILWALSWSLLTWFMSGTLANVCDTEHWHEDIGIMVCRIYKALFAFTLIGLYVPLVRLISLGILTSNRSVSTLAALCLDIYVRRQQTRRGIYRLQDLQDAKRPEATRGPFTVSGNDYAQSGLEEPRDSEAWEAPRPSIGPYSEQSDKQMGRQGYALPEQQFEYDTGYHGGHEDRAFGRS